MPNPTALIPPGVRVLTSPETPRDEWLALRNEGIGGSDALTVANLDPWRSPLGLWLQKTAHPDAPVVEPNEAMDWGHRMEHPLAVWFSDTTGIPVHECGMLGHPDYDWQLFTPDRLAEDGGIVEFKTTARMGHEWEDGQVSDRAAIQLQHGMAVTGATHGWAVAAAGGHPPVLRLVERDQYLIDNLTAMEEDFWKLVQERIPPAMGHPLDAEVYARLHPHGIEQAVELSPEAYQALLNHKMLGEQITAMEEQRKQFQAMVVQEMGDYTEGTYLGKPVVTWRNTGAVGLEALRAAHPDLAAEYTIQKAALDTKALYAAHGDTITPLRARRFLPKPKI